jgi:hypothetical protein
MNFFHHYGDDNNTTDLHDADTIHIVIANTSSVVYWVQMLHICDSTKKMLRLLETLYEIHPSW